MVLDSLRAARRRGRDDVPIHVAWGVLVLSIALRRFPALPWATKKFERLYKGRTAVERVNARPRIFWGADGGSLTGSRPFFALLGVILVVHAAFAHVTGDGAALGRNVGPDQPPSDYNATGSGFAFGGIRSRPCWRWPSGSSAAAGLVKWSDCRTAFGCFFCPCQGGGEGLMKWSWNSLCVP